MKRSDDRLWSPGLKKRVNRDGSATWYWVSSKCVRNTKGFEPKTARLIGAAEEERAHECRRLYGQLQEWLAETPRGRLEFDGTIGSVLDHYEHHPESPVQDVKYCTARSYRSAFRVMRKAVGHQKLVNVVGLDLKRWFNKLKRPSEPGAPEHLTRAHFYCSRLRDAVRFCASLSLPECQRLAAEFGAVRLKQPGARTEIVSYEQAVAIIDWAHRQGFPSIALGQAMQYELTLRQKDVIGEWFPQDAAPAGSGIRRRGKVWSGGVVWNDIDADMVLRKGTTKTGDPAEFDLSLYPLVMAEIDRVPSDRRIGPMLICEKSGLPWAQWDYYATWREIATLAGVPRAVQNRDSRAGGLTELGDFGIDIELMRHHAQHRNIKTTGRYNRGTLRKTSMVAELRAAARAKKNEAG